MTEPEDPTDGPSEPEAPDDATESAAESKEATLPAAAAPDYEGPRRRARREREERRTAQARATAIETARRDAKRRASGKQPDDTKRLGRGTVRGLKVLMWSALMSVIVVGLGLLLYFTPVMAARNFVVTGLGAVTQDEVTNAAGRAAGNSAATGRHRRGRGAGGGDPARRQRPGPAGVSVHVAGHRRRAGAGCGQGLSRRTSPFRPRRRGFRDRTATAGCAVPRHRAPGPRRSADEGGAAGDDLAAPGGGRPGRAASPRPRSPQSPCSSTDGRQVVWGTTDRTEEKAVKLGALLTQPGQTYDVSSPDLPTVK